MTQALMTYTLSLEEAREERDRAERRYAQKLEVWSGVAEKVPLSGPEFVTLGQHLAALGMYWLSTHKDALAATVLAHGSKLAPKVSQKIANRIVVWNTGHIELLRVFERVADALGSFEIELVTGGLTYDEARTQFSWIGTLMEARFAGFAPSPQDYFVLFHPDPDYVPAMSTKVRVVKLERRSSYDDVRLED